MPIPTVVFNAPFNIDMGNNRFLRFYPRNIQYSHSMGSLLEMQMSGYITEDFISVEADVKEPLKTLPKKSTIRRIRG